MEINEIQRLVERLIILNKTECRLQSEIDALRQKIASKRVTGRDHGITKLSK